MAARSGKAVLTAVGAIAAVAVGIGAGAFVVHDRQTNHDKQVSGLKAADAAQIAKLDAPVTAGVRSDGSHYGSLFAYLLPTPAGWSLGDGVGNQGDNTYLTQSQINAHVQSGLLNVPKSDLSSTKSTLTDLHLQGIALRSMVKPDETMQLSFVLLQLDPKAASADQKNLGLYVDGLGWRQGASVPGYPGVHCVLPPGLGSDKLDSMLCIGSYGDVEVILQTDGVAPLDQNTAAQMMAQQLNRLKSAQTLTVGSPDQKDQNE
jgi:hypothetical protein